MNPDIIETESLSNFVIGAFISKLLFGINIVQFFTYLEHFKEDKLYFKLLVWSCMFLGTITTIFASITSFQGGEGVPESWLNNSPWSFSCIAGIFSMISFQVQSFYAYRVWFTSKFDSILLRWILPILIIILAFISLGFGIATTGITFYFLNYSKFEIFSYGIQTWLFSAIVSDVLISGAIIYNLSIRRESGFVSNSNSIIDGIIKHTITNNLMTGLVAMTEVILFIELPKHSYYIITLDALSKLYVSSLLSSLISRRTYRKMVNGNIKSKTIKTFIEGDLIECHCHQISPWSNNKK